MATVSEQAPPTATGDGRGQATRWRLLIALFLVAAATVAVIRATAPIAHPARVGSVRDLGTLVQPTDWLRDGGESALVGGRILWIFGDTLFPTAATDGSHLRTNTAARSDPAKPFVLDNPTDANGAPVQFVPFDRLESDYNALSGKPDDRVGLWPTAVIARDGGSAVVMVEQVKIAPGGLNFTFLQMGLATVARGAETAVRDPRPLFAAPEPVFWSGPVEADGDVFMFGCDKIEGAHFGCRVARVPSEDLHERSAYRFWNGQTWSEDVRDATFAMDGPNGGLSVSWNPWLQRYLAVYLDGFTNRVVMRTAEHPEGPWSRPVVAFEGQAPAEGAFDYGAFEHPELASDDGRTIVITYFRPLGQLQGEIRVVRLRFE